MNEQHDSNEPNNSNESNESNNSNDSMEQVKLDKANTPETPYTDSFDHDSTTREIISEDIKMGFIDRIVSLFVSPVALMQNIKLFPVIGAAYLVCVVIGLASLTLSEGAQEVAMREMSNISIERFGIDLFGGTLDADIYGDDTGNVMDTALLVTNIMTAILLPFIMCFLSTLGLFILTKILRGPATFGQYFSMTMHLYIISAIAMVVGYASFIFTERMLDITSLAALLMPEGNVTMIEFNLLSSISVFSVWATILVFIGVKVINEWSVVKATIVTLIYFVVSTAIGVGIASSTFFLMDMAFTG